MQVIHSQQKRINLLYVGWLIFIATVDIAFFSITNPLSASATLVIIGGVLLSISIYSLCYATVRVFSIIRPLAKSTERVLVLTMAIPFIYALLMQSIGQLNTKDVFSIVPLALIVYFYTTYSYKSKLGKGVR